MIVFCHIPRCVYKLALPWFVCTLQLELHNDASHRSSCKGKIDGFEKLAISCDVTTLATEKAADSKS